MIHGKQIQNNSVDVNKLIVSDNSVLNLTDNSFILSGDSVTTSFNTVSGLEVNFPNAPIGKRAIESSLVSQIAFAATFDSSITSLTQVEDGKLLVFGSFTQSNGVSANGLVKLNADGTTDTAFDIGTGPDSTIFEVLWDGSKYYVAGTFSSFNGSSVAGLVRLNVDGSIDNTFVAPTGNTSGVVKCAIQSDSKIVVCGEGISGQVLRLNTDGSIDGSFDVGTGFLGGGVTDLLVQTGDKLIVIGNFTTYSGNSYTTNIIRINSDGSVDSDFMNNVGTGCGNPPQKLFDFDNDEFVLTMNSASYNGGPASAVKIINYEGIEDTTFATNYTNEGNANADDIGVVPGACVFSYQLKGNFFKKHNVDGTVDSSYTPSASGYQPMVGVQENGDNFVFFGSFSGLQKFNVDTPTEATVDVPSIVSEVIFEYNNDYTSRFGKYSLVDNNYVTGNTWLNGGETILGETTDIRVGAEGEFLPTMLTMSVTEIEGGLGGNSLTLKSQNSEYEFSISGVHGGNHGMFLGTSASKFIFLAGSMGNSIKFYDIRENHVGLEYYADYSSGFTKHSMVDVNYVTGITSTLGDTTLAGNGLTKSGDVIKLGGIITGDTTIQNTVNSFILNGSDYPGEIYWSGFDGVDERGYIFNYGTRIELFVNKNDTAFGYGLAPVLIGYDTIEFGSSKKVTFNGNNGLLNYNSSINANTGVTDNTLISYGFGKNNFLTKNISNNLANTSDTQTVLTTGNIGVGSTSITFKNDSGDTLATSITIQDSQKRGLQYGGDYTTGFTKHSLVDVNYVTGITSTISANVGNGLSKDAGTIVLGGSLLNNTDITATGSTHTTTISLGQSSFNAALSVATEYNDGFTMGSTTFEVKHFNGTVMTFDDLNGGWNEFKVGSSGIEATSNGNNFGRYSLLDVSNANQYGKPDEQPQVFQQIVEDDGTVNDVLFSPYGFDVTMRNADDDDLAKFVITKTGTTFTDGRAIKAGIEYKGDYSTGFTKHSLVDVNYVTGITSQISTALVVVSGSVAGNVVVDLSSADVFLLTLTGNVTTFNFTGETIGKQYMFKMIMDTTNKTFTWASGRYRFPFGNAPVLTNPTTNGSSPAHSEDIITAICMSSGRLDVVITPDMQPN